MSTRFIVSNLSSSNGSLTLQGGLLASAPSAATQSPLILSGTLWLEKHAASPQVPDNETSALYVKGSGASAALYFRAGAQTEIDLTGGGGLEGSNNTWTGTNLFENTVTLTGATLDADTSSAITLDAGAASNFNTSAGDITIDAAAGSVNIDGGEADGSAIKLHASAATGGGVDIDAGTGGVDILTTGAFSVDGAAASNISVVSAEADENLTISVTGATASSLILSSAGTGTDAIDISATAGGLDVDAAGAIAIDGLTHTVGGAGTTTDVAATATGGDMTLTVASAGDAEDLMIKQTGNHERNCVAHPKYYAKHKYRDCIHSLLRQPVWNWRNKKKRK